MKSLKNREELKNYISHKKPAFITHLILNLLVLAGLIRAVWLGNYGNAFLCVLVLALFLIPHFLRARFHISLPNTLEIIILLFVFCAEILGELQCYYLQYPHWDTMLHTTWGFLCAAIGFSLIDILNQDKNVKFNLSPFFVAVMAFCFSMTVGVFWEFFEFSMDWFFHMDMQKDTVITQFYSTLLDPTQSNVPYAVEEICDTLVNGTSLGVKGYLDIGIVDTMQDLFVNFIGALVFSVFGYFYIKHRGKGMLAGAFIPVLDNEGENSDKNVSST